MSTKKLKKKKRRKNSNYWAKRKAKKKLVKLIDQKQLQEARSRRKIVSTKVFKELKLKRKNKKFLTCHFKM